MKQTTYIIQNETHYLVLNAPTRLYAMISARQVGMMGDLIEADSAPKDRKPLELSQPERRSGVTTLPYRTITLSCR